MNLVLDDGQETVRGKTTPTIPSTDTQRAPWTGILTDIRNKQMTKAKSPHGPSASSSPAAPS
jgi:hypothetical protein